MSCQKLNKLINDDKIKNYPKCEKKSIKIFGLRNLKKKNINIEIVITNKIQR